MATKDQQVRHVVEGMALGVLAQNVEAVTSAKPPLELAFNAAWRRWPIRSAFPNIAGAEAGNLFWIGLGKSERRVGARAGWSASGPWLRPYVMLDGWNVEDCLETHADERASAADWRELGGLYVQHFKSEHLVGAGES
ncbi:hypothetical protein [Amycolatopsis granulosa]|uniref:hypothetical protein n=1 Tax=Amycolatopsis granulosa TaxID=185684 RepID=UPI0014216D38|nr:hypothetical protein [Amycolatopsis granulosa]NIH86022.1 hypothetical protein [Amycolatopsis granulosa]